LLFLKYDEFSSSSQAQNLILFSISVGHIRGQSDVYVGGTRRFPKENDVSLQPFLTANKVLA
jgi:hypothetical protein